MSALFTLGQVVATPGALAALEGAKQPPSLVVSHGFSTALFSFVDQLLTGDAVAHPRNRFQALAVNLLPAVETLAESTLTDPFQGANH